jgi:hypothetical protein
VDGSLGLAPNCNSSFNAYSTVPSLLTERQGVVAMA